jgi:hypothetical protein
MRTFFSFLKVAAIVIVLLIGYLVVDFTLLGRGVPPAIVKTFDAFLEWRPEATDFYAIENPPRLVAIGRSEGLVVSGPAAYVFDESGKLIEWEVEMGEGGQVTKLLKGRRMEIDQDRAKAWLKDHVR